MAKRLFGHFDQMKVLGSTTGGATDGAIDGATDGTAVRAAESRPDTAGHAAAR